MLDKKLKIILFIYIIIILYLYNNYYDYIYENSVLIPIFAMLLSVINLNIKN